MYWFDREKPAPSGPAGARHLPRSASPSRGGSRWESAGILCLILSVTFSLHPRPSGAAETGVTAREIMAGYREQRSSRDERSKLTMKLIDSRGRERTRKLEQTTMTDERDNQRMLITVEEPEDLRGTAFLIIENSDADDDQWLYLPAFRRVRRVLPNEKSDAFLGSDFFYGDLETEDLEHHSYRLIGEESLDGRSCWIIEALPGDEKTRKESGYGKRELWITKENFIGLQTRFYDRKGKLFKVFRALDVREIEGTGKWRAFRLEMHSLKSGHRTIILYDFFDINRGVPEWIFTKAYLGRGK